MRSLSLFSSGFVVSFFLRVPHQKDHLAVGDYSDVESVLGFRPGSKFSSCEIPKYTNIPTSGSTGDVELLGPILLPEDKGLDMEVKSWGRERKRVGKRKRREVSGGGGVELEVEGSAEEVAGPGESDDAKIRVVDAGGEIGVPGAGRRLRRPEVVNGGGGGGCRGGWWPEA